MLPDYADILALAPGRQPDWWDDDGVPRFAPFHPDMLGVYDSWAILAEIGCQGCARRLLVGVGWSKYQQYIGVREGDPMPEPWSLAKLAATFGYGDPPRHDSTTGQPCAAGATMSSYPTRIVQAWQQVVVLGQGYQWQRDPVCEGALDMPDWAR